MLTTFTLWWKYELCTNLFDIFLLSKFPYLWSLHNLQTTEVHTQYRARVSFTTSEAPIVSIDINCDEFLLFRQNSIIENISLSTLRFLAMRCSSVKYCQLYICAEIQLAVRKLLDHLLEIFSLNVQPWTWTCIFSLVALFNAHLTWVNIRCYFTRQLLTWNLVAEYHGLILTLPWYASIELHTENAAAFQ